MNLDSPAGVWLFPAGVAALLLLQLWRRRRRELLAGSLLIWRRVAAQERRPARRRFVPDLPFWLEVGTLAALAVALAGPVWMRAPASGRRLVLVLDSGPSARARQAGGRLVWEELCQAARDLVTALPAQTSVALMVSSPSPHRVDAGEGLAPGAAVQALEGLVPALSGPAAGAVWPAALQEARVFGGGAVPAAVVVLSARAAPAEATATGPHRWRTLGPGPGLDNVGLTAFGSSADGSGGAEILVQVRNFSSHEARGQVVLQVPLWTAPPPVQHEARPLTLAPGAVAGIAFTVRGEPLPPLAVAWQADGGPDAWPEDDWLTTWPRGVGAPRVRWHGGAPHLEELYRLALGATRVPLDAPGAVDLEVYVDAVPDGVPPSARAVLLLAPATDYGPFEVLPQLLAQPVARLGDEDPLTRNVADTPEGLGFPIAQARHLRQTGDLRVLIQDADGNPLAARFRLADGRPGYVFAFVPGEGLGWAPERKFDRPALAALLVRLLREAYGAGEPYAVETAAALERASGRPLPLDWKPGLDAARGVGEGVLDATASRLELGVPTEAALDLAELVPAPHPRTAPLWPWLVALAAGLILAEVRLERSLSRRPVGAAQS